MEHYPVCGNAATWYPSLKARSLHSFVTAVIRCDEKVYIHPAFMPNGYTTAFNIVYIMVGKLVLPGQ